MKGAALAILGLTLLQAALSGRTNAGRIGELGQAVADVLSRVIDPDVPAIPDLRTTSTTGPGGKAKKPRGTTTDTATLTT